MPLLSQLEADLGFVKWLAAKKRSCCGNDEAGGISMMDVLFVFATLSFFATGIAYVFGCEKLK
jgi:hypothetical protein